MKLFLFILVAVPVIVTGLPQKFQLGVISIQPPGPVAPPSPPKSLLINSQKSDFMGVIKLQIFLNNGTRKLVKVHESNTTFDASSLAEKRKCPEDDQLMYKPDGKCYRTGPRIPGTDSPCANSLMTFAEIEPGYGDCYCVMSQGGTRPVVVWQDNRCYTLFEKGPCKRGDWLIFSNETDSDGDRYLVCTRRTCPENKVDPLNNYPEAWFEYNGRCLQAEVPNPEFCKDNTRKVYFSIDKPSEAVCLERRPVRPGPVKNLVGSASTLGCKSGHKQLPNGQCKRVVSFEL